MAAAVAQHAAERELFIIGDYARRGGDAEDPHHPRRSPAAVVGIDGKKKIVGTQGLSFLRFRFQIRGWLCFFNRGPNAKFAFVLSMRLAGRQPHHVARLTLNKVR